MHILKKGTVVKHGTISSLLPAILDKGLQPRAHTHLYRSKSETSPHAGKGVYVGGVLAYNAAYLSFADAAKQLGQRQIDIKKGAVPIVLEIELAEDCPILADEDFVMLEEQAANGGLGWEHKDELERRMVEDAQEIWEKYRTAAIVREGGIPASWINKIEFPEVKRVVSQKIEIEASLFAIACYFHRNRTPEKQTVEALSEFGVTVGLSDSASRETIMRCLSEYSTYKDVYKRADYIDGFHKLVGVQLDRIGVPQIY